MKKVFFILIMFFALHVKSQNITELGKYSYFCFAVNNNKTIDGTCFFYRAGNGVYLVTNYHVFYGADILNNKQVIHVDTLRVSYISSKTKTQKFYKITDTDSVHFFKHYDAPDLMAKKLTNIPDDFAINCVNDMVEPDLFKQRPDSVIVFGYPGLYNKITGADQVKTQRCYVTGNVDGTSVNVFDHTLLKDATIKNVNKVKRKIEKKEFEITVGSLPGFSGSPVYGRYYKNGTYQYKFAGIIFASDILNNTSVAINANTFADYMKGMNAD